MSHVILEVVDGPMDGLNAMISKSGLVGRSVGTVLALALDLEVSGRHCEVVLEGPTWCLRDQKSTNGTWFRSERLVPGLSYPIPDSQIFLVGSTVVQLYKGSVTNNFIAITDPGIKDPRNDYSMSHGLKNVWNKLYSTARKTGDFCDTSKLFVALLEEMFGTESIKYDSYNQVKSGGRFKILDSWLLNASFESFYQLAPNTLTIAPRVWRILDVAATEKQGKIGIDDILKAILVEGRSLAGRHMARDLLLLEAVGMIPKGANTSVYPSIVPEPKRDETTRGKKYHPPTAAAIEDDVWGDFGVKIERLVKGFLEDAANPIAGNMALIPGLQRGIQEVMAISDPAMRHDILREHLDLVYNLLIAVLASQREGSAVFGKKLAVRIDKTIARSQGKNNNVLSLGNKKIDPADVANSIRGALAKADSSGLSDRIVRAVLMDKIKKFGIGG